MNNNKMNFEIGKIVWNDIMGYGTIMCVNGALIYVLFRTGKFQSLNRVYLRLATQDQLKMLKDQK